MMLNKRKEKKEVSEMKIEKMKVLKIMVKLKIIITVNEKNRKEQSCNMQMIFLMIMKKMKRVVKLIVRSMA